MNNTHHKTISQHPRRGSVLIVILVVVVMLSLAAYQFSEQMTTESLATMGHSRNVDARLMADSGVEMVAAMLSYPEEYGTQNLYSNPEMFHGILMKDTDVARHRGMFSIIASDETDPEYQTIRFGLMDESGKLNLRLLARVQDQDTAREMLLNLPDMTEDVADAILDWMDEDDEPREFGAEMEYYSTLEPPYFPSNAPFTSLDELLLVADITPERLFGEDANRNGILDPNEDDGDASMPFDNGDGMLDTGWSSYLTLHSKESGVRLDGQMKINVNMPDLELLYDTLAEQYGDDEATFIVAYRIYGAAGQQQQRGGGNTAAPTIGGATAPATGAQGPGPGGGQEEEPDPIDRNGLNVAQTPRFTINSLYDLVGVTVQAEIDDNQETLTSPWPEDPAVLSDLAADLFDVLTFAEPGSLEGRININFATREVLMCIPEITVEQVEIILGDQNVGINGEVYSADAGVDATTARLYAYNSELFPLDVMRTIGPYITTKGAVYRLQVLGYYEAGGAYSRVEAMVDASVLPARILFQRDLTHLGRGYSRAQMGF